MNAVATTSTKNSDTRDYVARITVQLEKTIRGFIEIGRLLNEAHESLGRKRWLAMVTDELPFTRRTAEKLMKIATDQRLNNPHYMAKLPPHWTSLHELTLLNDEQLEYGFSENIIRPDAERKDITALKDWRPCEHQHSRNTAAQPGTFGGAASGVASQITGNQVAEAPAATSGLPGIAVRLIPTTHTPLKDIRKLIEEISAVCERFSTAVELAPAYDNLLKIHEEAQRYLRSARQEFRHGTRDNDLGAIKDAFYQIGTGNKLAPNADGSPNPRDIVSSEHTYGELDFKGLAGYCQDLQIVSQYTPVKDLDDRAYSSMLLLIHLEGNPKERASAFKMLSEHAKTSKLSAWYLEVLNAQ